MNTRDLTTVLPTLFSELVYGAPRADVGTYMLNRGDLGLLHALDQLSASAASITPTGGASIAAHVEHLRYGLSLLNRWAAGADTPWKAADWTAAWRKPVVTDDEWRRLREELRREADGWCVALRTPREVGDAELAWTIGTIGHLGYHLGAIRQIDRATRGPTADEERAFQKD